jgi:EmrB/QacA subfamily drug resistance transporter
MNAMSADASSIHWVMTAFQIARTVPMPALGWLSSLIGHRRLYITGLAITVLSTICCGLSWNLESLIFFRVMQGLSAAPAQVTGMVILYEAFPAGQRGLVLGLLLLAGSLGPTIGPSLGGYLVQEYSWRAMFYLSLPTAVLSLLLTPVVLSNMGKPPRPGFDPLGLLCMAVWVTAALLAISQGQREGWDSAYILGLFAIAGGFFVGFVLLELHGSQPFVDLKLYTNPRFVIASLAAMLFDAGFNSANFLTALMLQQTFLLSPAQAGLILAPGAIAMGVVGVAAGRLADISEPLWPILLGLFLQALAMYALGHISLVSTTGWLTALVVVYRLSFGCVHSPLTKTVLQNLPSERLSMGSGLDGIHRGFASAFGIAIGSMVLERRLTAHLVGLGETHDVLAPVVRDTTTALSDVLLHTGTGMGSLDEQTLAALWNHLRQEAQIGAYQDAFLLLCGMTLLAVVPAIVACSRHRRP